MCGLCSVKQARCHPAHGEYPGFPAYGIPGASTSKHKTAHPWPLTDDSFILRIRKDRHAGSSKSGQLSAFTTPEIQHKESISSNATSQHIESAGISMHTPTPNLSVQSRLGSAFTTPDNKHQQPGSEEDALDIAVESVESKSTHINTPSSNVSGPSKSVQFSGLATTPSNQHKNIVSKNALKTIIENVEPEGMPIHRPAQNFSGSSSSGQRSGCTTLGTQHMHTELVYKQQKSVVDVNHVRKTHRGRQREIHESKKFSSLCARCRSI
ncbi:uncharacterized protein MELLADRAFT_104449 [Melampsora larici-populina 98AG31]|uniref:Uncharacterized protein n=1 Tax=Melampsora larici-populina (strain 98AG31 / pathotype 3-4-7) TaxID=747676 RepID=F4REQ8_MELLP|nr:uncharacterized protein MELLADRAFT_104449 [Melampsora larici-populina 98AG31]EGG09141.1 hypothetical protein MELLADRAFT_104449 [Melampsora larici-populina 98AG31]